MRIITCLCLFSFHLLAEEPLPPRAIARIGDYRFYHGPGIDCAALSPDGRFVVSAAHWGLDKSPDEKIEAYERVVKLWNTTTGELLHELQVPQAPVRRLLFAQDSKSLTVWFGRDNDRRSFETSTGKTMAGGADEDDAKQDNGKRTTMRPAWADDREYVWRMLTVPDGKLTAALVDIPPDYSKVPVGVHVPPHIPKPTILIVLDSKTERPLYRKKFAKGCLDRFVFAADGKSFFTADDKQVIIHDVATGEEQWRLDAQGIRRISPSPDGSKVLLSSGWSKLCLWDLQTRKLTHELMSDLTYVNDSAASQPFSADGKTVLVVTRSEFRLFDTTTGKEKFEFGHRAHVVPRFAKEGNILVTSSDELTRSWALASGKSPKLVASEIPTPRSLLRQVAVSDDGKLFVSGEDKILALCESATGRVIRSLDKNSNAIRGDFSRDSRKLLVWHMEYEDKQGVIRIGPGELIRLYDVATGTKTGEFTALDIAGHYPTMSPDGAYIAWADRSNTIHLHEAATGKVVRTMKPDNKLPTVECNDSKIVFSPDGNHVSVTMYQHEPFKKPGDAEDWVSFPTRVFATASGDEVGRFDANPVTKGNALKLSCAALSPTSSLLAVAEDESGSIRVFDVASGGLRATFEGHRHGVHALEFSPDGTTLASGGIDGVVFLWDVNASMSRK